MIATAPRIQRYAADADYGHGAPRAATHNRGVTRHVRAESVERLEPHRFTPKLCTPQGDDPAQLCQCQATAWAPLRPLPGFIARAEPQCPLAVACHNMKKTALILARLFGRLPASSRRPGVLGPNRVDIRRLFGGSAKSTPAQSLV